MQRFATPVDRLLAHSVLLPDGCWWWTGSRFPTNQRPRIAVRINGNAQWITVARFIVQFVHGERWTRAESRRKCGAHSCDCGDCVNPDHVSKKTQKQNMRECVARGRHVSGWKQYNEQRRQQRYLDCCE